MRKNIRENWTVMPESSVIKFKKKMNRRLRHDWSCRKEYALINFKIHKFISVVGAYGNEIAIDMLGCVMSVVKEDLSKKELFCGNEEGNFYLFLEEKEEETMEERLNRLDEKIKKSSPIRGIQIKYGLYRITDRTVDVNRMFIYANQTRHLVKGSQNFAMQIFSEEQHEKLKYEQELEESAQEALEKKEFAVYLQPKYKADGSRVEGAEALVRWISDAKGFIAPNKFIPLFEKNGFICKLDEYMLDRVCELQEKWMKAGKRLITISVNISRVHLLDLKLVERIIDIVEKHEIPRDCIELELTESAFFEDKEVLQHTVQKLRLAGFKVSMDDFGSGYSSLNSLKDLPIDVVKMDGEFFNFTSDKKRSSIIIEDAVKLVKDLDMEIVAEGIEHKEQVDFLNAIGCDLIQGFYFAKPMPVMEFEKLVYA